MDALVTSTVIRMQIDLLPGQQSTVNYQHQLSCFPPASSASLVALYNCTRSSRTTFDTAWSVKCTSQKMTPLDRRVWASAFRTLNWLMQATSLVNSVSWISNSGSTWTRAWRDIDTPLRFKLNWPSPTSLMRLHLSPISWGAATYAWGAPIESTTMTYETWATRSTWKMTWFAIKSTIEVKTKQLAIHPSSLFARTISPTDRNPVSIWSYVCTEKNCSTSQKLSSTCIRTGVYPAVIMTSPWISKLSTQLNFSTILLRT